LLDLSWVRSTQREIINFSFFAKNLNISPELCSTTLKSRSGENGATQYLELALMTPTQMNVTSKIKTLLGTVILLGSIALPGHATSVPSITQPSGQQQSIELAPVTLDGYLERGKERLDQGNVPGAIADFTKVIETDPTIAEAYCHRSIGHAIRGDLQLAMDDLNKALAIDPQHAEAYSRRGAVYAEQGELAAASSDFNKAIDIDPELSEGYYNRGNFHATQGRSDDAIADFTEAIRLEPTAADAYGSRGIAQYTLGNRKQALQDLRTAAKLFQEQGDRERYEMTVNYIGMVKKER
jgi:tetratricopeptide (TPR) repeat protein